eukprot:TRINITY_DN48415_c0_g1_i1.p1 TRINITY_DN48415_c0_g1~~TRINITY_DN48415_c0_g1_i1.p1  ORF type:complete len:225 (+),score=57.58 TRINITY_DN48415_c0_g1_i1:53-676(+)
MPCCGGEERQGLLEAAAGGLPQAREVLLLFATLCFYFAVCSTAAVARDELGQCIAEGREPHCQLPFQIGIATGAAFAAFSVLLYIVTIFLWSYGGETIVRVQWGLVLLFVVGWMLLVVYRSEHVHGTFKYSVGQPAKDQLVSRTGVVGSLVTEQLLCLCALTGMVMMTANGVEKKVVDVWRSCFRDISASIRSACARCTSRCRSSPS